MFECVDARPTIGIATFDCCDAVRATSGREFVGARPTTDCEPVCVEASCSMFDVVDARPTSGCIPITVCEPDCVGARPVTDGMGCEAVPATTGCIPITVCEPDCVGARPELGCEPVCVGVRPITGIATFDCCDAVRATTGCIPITVCELAGSRPTDPIDGGDPAGSMFDFVDARPTTACMPITVCEVPTAGCDPAGSTFDCIGARPVTDGIGCEPVCVGVRPITGIATFDCCDAVRATTGDDVRASTGCELVTARGNGGGTDAARGNTGGVVPTGVRRGIGGGCDGRGDDVCVWGWGSTAVCSSFVAIATARDALGEPDFSQSIR